MPSRKEGWWAANTPWGASTGIRDKAALIQQLMSTLAGEGLKNVKNVRNRQEFQALADSLSAGLKTGNSDEGIQAMLEGFAKAVLDHTGDRARAQAGLPVEEEPKESKPKDMPEGARQAPDGHFYVPDPARPGKYLRVD